MKFTRAVLFGLTFAAVTAAHAQYQWVDKDGRRVFSDRPPPADVAPKNIVSQPRGSTAAVVRSATAVGTGVVNAATLLDLELAVVGGGFSLVADDYVEHIRAAVDARAVNAFARAVRVERAALAGDAPLIGAAALVHRSDLLA